MFWNCSRLKTKVVCEAQVIALQLFQIVSQLSDFSQRGPDDVPITRMRCCHAGCETHPVYGDPTTRKREFCFKHKASHHIKLNTKKQSIVRKELYAASMQSYVCLSLMTDQFKKIYCKDYNYDSELCETAIPNVMSVSISSMRVTVPTICQVKQVSAGEACDRYILSS
uniref:Uncharacterized protein n=1 Tax=Guillardia theta TaxID=55529 RepID=A0A7S4L4Q0_GUITH|mmetsp:Transcript_37427/g.117972  ORF Transcript_37427/g.117972 Transcript_37427/m.117972 type:complete len:168 (+) Transcript_37427:875-1378(+)